LLTASRDAPEMLTIPIIGEPPPLHLTTFLPNGAQVQPRPSLGELRTPGPAGHPGDALGSLEQQPTVPPARVPPTDDATHPQDNWQPLHGRGRPQEQFALRDARDEELLPRGRAASRGDDEPREQRK
jgi:hypothetical protein